jgi:hypothetical protein
MVGSHAACTVHVVLVVFGMTPYCGVEEAGAHVKCDFMLGVGGQ